MERFFDVFHAVPKNKRDAKQAALTVAKELVELWKLGDARIPLFRWQTIQEKILEMHGDLRFINNKSKIGQPAYVFKVRLELTNCVLYI